MLLCLKDQAMLQGLHVSSEGDNVVKFPMYLFEIDKLVSPRLSGMTK